MTTHTQFGFGYGTAAQIGAYNGLQFEPVYDTDNQRVVVMLGTGAGNKVAMASEAFVTAAIASVSAGANAYLQWSTCT
ncbi:hypothetical protein ACQR13_21055 [Bradyrhizobium sp. HKCCYLRH3059]|uniref:hypothetical protein n=1 Tax=Bradyrhizobium sp. HKCCYLRH3059 TaxID=3420745 RepID=UPI003EBE8A44